MRYWGYLAVKLVAAAAALYGLGLALARVLPKPELHPNVTGDAFGHSLGFTVLVMVYTVACAGLLGLIVIDHRYRCRTCLRRLRMPLATGSWTHVLMGRPRTEYICPFGHGTLKVEELQITGHAEPDWKPNEDIWTELLKK
jgi:hypothetical protein